MSVIGQAVDKRPGAAGRRARYDVYAVTGESVRVRITGWVRPDGTVAPMIIPTIVIEMSRARLFVHINPSRRYV